MSATEIHLLREMIRADLELAFDHLNNDDERLADRELENARQKISQITQLKNASSTGATTAVTKQPLLILSTDHDGTKDTGR